MPAKQSAIHRAAEVSAKVKAYPDNFFKSTATRAIVERRLVQALHYLTDPRIDRGFGQRLDDVDAVIAVCMDDGHPGRAEARNLWRVVKQEAG